MKKSANSKTMADFDNAPYVRIRMGDDLDACRDALRPELALYIGGMGARSKNFYNDLAKRLGYEEAAETIQNFYLDGKKKDAEAAVPAALIDEISLVGPAGADQGPDAGVEGRRQEQQGSHDGADRRLRGGAARGGGGGVVRALTPTLSQGEGEESPLRSWEGGW